MRQSLLYRLGGLVAVLAGVALAWWGIWQPLEAARAHAPEVHYQLKIFVAVPVAIVFGLYFLIGGNAWPYRDVEKKQLTLAGWLLMAVVAICSAGTYFWLTSMFEALGYRNG